MAGLLSALELELRIALLPPVSRAAHLDGPRLHAERLVELWKVDDSDHVPLAQGWRLLDVETVAGAILRVMVMGDKDYSGDPRVWRPPGLEDLLPELHALTWRAMRDGTLQVEGIWGARGKDYSVVLPVELPRLVPDWSLSRLTLGGHDELVDVRIWHAPSALAATEAADVAAFAGEQVATGALVATESADVAAFVGQQIASGIMVAVEAADSAAATRLTKRPWGSKKPSAAKLRAAMEAIERDYPPDAHPSEKEVWGKLETHCGPLARATVRSALEGSRLKGQRGYHSTKSPT